MNLKELTNQSIVLLGKSRAFVENEFISLLKYHKIELLGNVNESVTFIVEGRMLTPYEQNSLAAFYEEGKYTFINIDTIENALAKELNPDMLLMSLKLSHDKERLQAYIKNSMISDALFFKLIKMYQWQGEDFFENDANRDVSAAFISRFYENIEQNHNVQYATTGFFHLVSQTKSASLLQAIYELEPMSFHPKIVSAIAMSKQCDEALQERLYKHGESFVFEALSFNENLKISLVTLFLKDKELGRNVARSLQLDEVLFSQCRKFASSLAQNESLTLAMQEELLEMKDDEVNLGLAWNKKLEERVLLALLQKADEKLLHELYENSAMPQELLEKAYKEGLFMSLLAKNENTPVEILYQLQLDSRYERAVKTNAAFGKHIQSENIGWLV